MDHPFDDLAVKAAERAIEQTVGMDWPSKDCAQAALTAACNSMKERGKVRDGKGYDLPRETPPSDWAVWTDKKPGFENECFYVTIFRHGE